MHHNANLKLPFSRPVLPAAYSDNSLNHLKPLIVIVIAALWFNPLQADTVQQWRDSQGQLHFGDGVSSPQQARPVIIKNPISVVTNANPSQAVRTHESKRLSLPEGMMHMNSRQHAMPTEYGYARHKRHAYARQMQHASRTCDPWQNQQATHGYVRQLDKQMRHQASYDKDCIQGHYYGEANNPRR